MKPAPFVNSYARLGDDFYVKTEPSPVANPRLIRFNQSLAAELALEGTELGGPEAVDFFAGNRIPAGADPLAMAYAGHQFGGFSPQLGDGRAILLGELRNTKGQRFDLQLKGSGRTFFSRNGDGRSALGPVLREYLVSEAMAKLGVPTTRALAAVTTGEKVVRDGYVPGGILTRVASSFVRVGTFEYFKAKGNREAIRQLADYVIARSYPEVAEADNPHEALLTAVIERQADLIAQWMQLGFIHGVMNTDNMSIAGETIDYGPCAFMDAFAWHRVYSSIDHQGRYAYFNQPAIGQWNLIRFAETLLPLLVDGEDGAAANAAVERAEITLNRFRDLYQTDWLSGMRQKLGLTTAHQDDQKLIEDLLETMEKNRADFTLTFYQLSQLSIHPGNGEGFILELFNSAEDFRTWLGNWRKRLALEPAEDEERQAQMQSINPVYIPRNHQIEAAIRAAEDHDDFSVFHQLHEVLQNPFEVQPGKEPYRLPPTPEQEVRQTFCGT